MNNKATYNEKWIMSQLMFAGFYNTILSDFDEVLIESDGEDVIDKIDYKSFNIDLSKEIFGLSMKFLKSKWILKKLHIEDIKFQKLHSPEFYNYSNDKIYCEYIINIDKQKEYKNLCMDDLINTELEAIDFSFLEEIFYDIKTDISNYIA